MEVQLCGDGNEKLHDAAIEDRHDLSLHENPSTSSSISSRFSNCSETNAAIGSTIPKPTDVDRVEEITSTFQPEFQINDAVTFEHEDAATEESVPRIKDTTLSILSCRY